MLYKNITDSNEMRFIKTKGYIMISLYRKIGDMTHA